MTNICWEGELHRIEGELMRVQGGSTPEIESCFARAIAITRTQGAKSLELRAARTWRVCGVIRGGAVMRALYSHPCLLVY